MSANDMDMSLFEVFLGDARKISKSLGDGLLASMDSLTDVDRMTSLMRLAHSMKGAASSVLTAEEFPALAPVVELSQALEACFNAAKCGRLALTPLDIGEFLECVGHISAMGDLQPQELASWLQARTQVLRDLARRVSDIEHGRVPASSPAPASAPLKPAAAEPQNASAASTQAPPAAPAVRELADMPLLGLFKTEAETQAQILAEGLMKLEADPSGAPDTLASLMRAAHSLKGAARIIQLDELVVLAHSMENCLVAAMEGRVLLEEPHFDLLLDCVDLIAALPQLPEAELGQFAARNAVRFNELAAACDSIKAGSGFSAPAASNALPLSKAAQSAPSSEASSGEAVRPLRSPAAVAPAAVETKAAPEPSAQTAVSEPGEASVRPQAVEPASKSAFVRVGADKLSALLGLAGESLVDAKRMRVLETGVLALKSRFSELAAAGGAEQTDQERLADLRRRQEEFYRDISSLYTQLSDFLLKMENFSSSLYNEVFACRIRPFEDGVGGFPRMVRDIAKRLGKKVRLEIKGRRTDVDRDILEKLEAPLNHIIRNALDHGVESPEERVKLGKPEAGVIEISAYHWAGSLNIKVVDDGRGIDIDAVRRKVVKKGLATEEMVKGMLDQEILEFLFLPGFSTASAVTEISGRGVGLDVVQSMLHEVRGSVRIDTTPGKGTCFHLQLPVTLSVVPALLVSIADEPYAFPLVRVDRLARVRRDDIRSLESRQFIEDDGVNVGIVSIRELLGLPPRELEEEVQVVMIGDRSVRYAVVVDSFIGERDIVVHPLDERLGKVSFISAASLTDDGFPLLILDVDDMLRSIDNLLKGGGLHRIKSAETVRRERKRVLVADDSITVRELERNLLSNNGYLVDVAFDGTEAWNAVRLGDYDIVVTDVDMPRMNGFELAEKIKSNDRLKSIPVVIVSYKDREEDRLRGLDAGADYYLTKGSFHDNSFIQAVNDLTGGSAK